MTARARSRTGQTRRGVDRPSIDAELAAGPAAALPYPPGLAAIYCGQAFRFLARGDRAAAVNRLELARSSEALWHRVYPDGQPTTKETA